MRGSPSPASPSVERPYVCTEAGCSKAFVRSEHLSRHRLNHRPIKVFACFRCPKKFVRPDLYQRHKARHDKGMWYRNVGGVVETENRESETQPQDSTLTEDGAAFPDEEIQTPRTPTFYPHRSRDAQHEDYNDLSVPVDRDSVIVDNNYDASTSNTDLNFNYASPPDRPDTVFFDGSANIDDLPENLDWFFELPIPGPLSSADIAIDPVPYTSLIPSPLPKDLQPSSLMLSTTNDRTWRTVRSRVVGSLYSLQAEILQSVFFCPGNLAACYDLYFENYHPHFPILHRPTFVVTDVEPLLIIAIITLGSTLSKDENLFNIGQRIHDSLRWIIFQTGHFEPPSPLWCLQALLLVQAQAKMFSTKKHHEMAHIFHGAILTMIKRGIAYSPIPVDNNNFTTLECSWLQWAEQESSRRTAFFAFVMDAQHASVFGHTPVLSVSDVRLPLPSVERLWECTTANQWQSLSRREPEAPQFLPTLKAVLGKTLVPTICSNFSRFILLHGLLSLTTHLRTRERATLGIETGRIGSKVSSSSVAPVEDWIEVISRAIGTWSFSLLSSEHSTCLEAARPLHRMAFITLHTNITDFHILAKDSSQLESQLSKREAAKAEARIRAWSRNEGAKQAVNHSLLLVKETIFAGNRYRAREDNIAPRPWCLYHGILVLWAFGVMTEGAEDENGMGVPAEEYVARMLSVLQTNGKIMGANRTKGLIVSARVAFEGCRWALLEEAYQTLGRLAGITS
ncbi:hypothetical protein V502_02490 [Pseudogymnoascus sp. VKM F-4520 (FW-2644)]|nr:hypothetical protein V502_02490 [Pseudogymnoascus sp. VKM F-4520 (FW-2644)]